MADTTKNHLKSGRQEFIKDKGEIMRSRQVAVKIFLLILLLSNIVFAQGSSDHFRFVILGDSRGERDGNIPPVFYKMISQVSKLNPAFVIHTGDTVMGSQNPEELQKQLKQFKKALEPLKVPFYAVPGNHEIRGSFENDRLFKKAFGSTYQSFNYGNSHFILLDSEVPGEEDRITGDQKYWLLHDLDKSQNAKHRFVVIHAPLYPVGPHKGSSLDRYPQDRDALNDIFRRYHVETVYAGHEHLYNRQVHDSVEQIISGGAGAPLYMTPSAGGFYHYLVVSVDGKQVKERLIRVSK